jgi:hypothetical protein
MAVAARYPRYPIYPMAIANGNGKWQMAMQQDAVEAIACTRTGPPSLIKSAGAPRRKPGYLSYLECLLLGCFIWENYALFYEWTRTRPSGRCSISAPQEAVRVHVISGRLTAQLTNYLPHIWLDWATI